MTTTTNPASQPASKHLNSVAYHKVMRKLVNRAKGLRPMLKRIPNALPKPGSEAYWAPNDAHSKDLAKRQEAYIKADQFRVDKAVLHELAVTNSFEENRR